MSTSVQYTLEGLSAYDNRPWESLTMSASLDVIKAELIYYKGWIDKEGPGTGWKDFRIVKVTINRDVLDPAAQPVADGPAGFSDSDRLEAIVRGNWSIWSERVQVKDARFPAYETVVNNSCGEFRNTDGRAAIDDAIRAQRKEGM